MPKFVSGVFLTFSGNCKEALTFYQTCFGGTLQFEFLEMGVQGYLERPVVSGSLVANGIVIYGSDLVPNEGRILGNNIAIFLRYANAQVRKELIQKLEPSPKRVLIGNDEEKLIEITDAFDVRWVLYTDRL